MTGLPPKSPRVRKSKPSRQKVIVQRQIGDTKRLSGEIPDAIKIAMASAIMAFSKMEMAAEHFIWDLLRLSSEDGKLVTSIDAKGKFELAKKLSDRYLMPLHEDPEKTKMAWAFVREMIEARNKMAHGIWSMIDGQTPVVASYRIPTEPGTVNSEHFPLERINAVSSTAGRVEAMFWALSTKLRSLPQKPSPPPPQPTTNYPEHPAPEQK
jgi:hypothetical protein